jgi:hypothetical protein
VLVLAIWIQHQNGLLSLSLSFSFHTCTFSFFFPPPPFLPKCGTKTSEKKCNRNVRLDKDRQIERPKIERDTNYFFKFKFKKQKKGVTVSVRKMEHEEVRNPFRPAKKKKVRRHARSRRRGPKKKCSLYQRLSYVWKIPKDTQKNNSSSPVSFFLL